jgi:hypothetical protein
MGRGLAQTQQFSVKNWAHQTLARCRNAAWGVAPPPEARIVALDPLPCGSPQASVSGGPLLAPGRNPAEPSPDGAAGSANILLADSPCAVGFSDRFGPLRQELLPQIGIP